MKNTLLLIFGLAFGICIIPNKAKATVTVSSNYGQLRDSHGDVIVSTTTMWALIYDENDDGTLPGNLGINDDSLAPTDIAAIIRDFRGVNIAVDQYIGNDRVILMGDFNDSNGIAKPFLDNVDLTARGLTSGRQYGFYFFPDQTTTTQDFTGDFEVGGINEVTNYFGAGNDAYIGTEIPDDGKTLSTVIIDTNRGGSLSTDRFTAVAVPEPSAFLLVTLGSLVLLRRRRS